MHRHSGACSSELNITFYRVKRSRRLSHDIRLAAEDPLKLGSAAWEFGLAAFTANATVCHNLWLNYARVAFTVIGHCQPLL